MQMHVGAHRPIQRIWVCRGGFRHRPMFRMFSRTGAHQKRAPALRRMSNNSATFSGLYVHGMLLLLNGLFGAARHSLVKGGGAFTPCCWICQFSLRALLSSFRSTVWRFAVSRQKIYVRLNMSNPVYIWPCDAHNSAECDEISPACRWISGSIASSTSSICCVGQKASCRPSLQRLDVVWKKLLQMCCGLSMSS